MTPELDAMARHVIDANVYMTLGTLDPDGSPRLSPVYFTPARYSDLYWVSSPDAHHSRNIAQRRDIQILIFDSTATVGAGEAVYLSATARVIGEDELEQLVAEAFDPARGARRFEHSELRGDADLRLYVAHVTSCEVHVPGRHPANERGVDVRIPADPALT